MILYRNTFACPYKHYVTQKLVCLMSCFRKTKCERKANLAKNLQTRKRERERKANLVKNLQIGRERKLIRLTIYKLNGP